MKGFHPMASLSFSFSLLVQTWNTSGSSIGIVANSNCTTAGVVVAHRPLQILFGLEAVSIVTTQAISGAGIHGLSTMHIKGNVVPHMAEEEEKIVREIRKIMTGSIQGANASPSIQVIESTKTVVMCYRVPVTDGHTISMVVTLKTAVSKEAVEKALRDYSISALKTIAQLPLICVMPQADRPQPRLDSGGHDGMAICVGSV